VELTILSLLLYRSHYKNASDHRKNLYHKAVSASDEAFIWQVMTFYPTFWKGEQRANEEDSVLDSSVSASDQNDTATSVTDASSASGGASSFGGSATSGRKGGPRKGFTETAGKTIDTYKQYLKLVGESRKANNTKLWSDRLMLIARQSANKKAKKTGKAAATVKTIQPNDDVECLQYAEIGVCEFDGNFGEDV
jgi:hypothetical protein